MPVSYGGHLTALFHLPGLTDVMPFAPVPYMPPRRRVFRHGLSLLGLLRARRSRLLLAMAALLGCGTTALTPAMAHVQPSQAPQGTQPPAGCTGPASGTWVRVVVEGVRNASGQVAITLYADDSSRFLVHHGALYVGRVKAVAGTTEGCIYVPRPGIYAIAVYHDANGNGKFDRNGVGLPAEGYGFSNNASTLLGLPSFDSVRLNIARSGLTTHIRLKYP